ncbi:hypothetical protein LCGC14_0720480 [marine sediment metagenome]|uniref:Uncharacterized protein n=1 Tax=marine sediment metagenome TaxID=412755 RepID=A0A0F9QCJ7_9ZZZZ
MAQIKFKKWLLSDDFSVQDIIDSTGNENDPVGSLQKTVKMLESKRIEGPKITTKILLKDFKKLQEKVAQAFL